MTITGVADDLHHFPTYGDYLYHFTTADKAFGGILRRGECCLRLNAYRLMRDPFEAREWAWEFRFDSAHVKQQTPREMLEPDPGIS
jgi:hypothetical protein